MNPAVNWVIAGYSPLGTRKLPRAEIERLKELGFNPPGAAQVGAGVQIGWTKPTKDAYAYSKEENASAHSDPSSECQVCKNTPRRVADVMRA